MKNYILIISLLFGFSIYAQNWTSLNPNENLPDLELNPLKGIAANFGSDNDFPHSISNKNFSYGELVNDAGGFEFGEIDSFIEQQALLGKFAMIQVNIDDANLINPLDVVIENSVTTYVGAKHDLPAFLNNVNRLYYQGRPTDGTTQNTDVNANVFPYDPADGGGNPSMVVDYNNTALVDAMVELITALGNKYDGDKRVFIVHYGMYGIFGEWGLGFGENYIDDLVDENGNNLGLVPEDWRMSDFNQGRIINAYQAAFNNTNLVARVPELPRPQEVGYSDGLYFGASLSDDPTFNYFFLPTLKRFNVDQNWKNHIIGGEMDPELQSKIWGELSPEGDFNYTVIGDDAFTQGQDIEQNVEDVFQQTHPTFIFQNYVMQQQFIGLEGANHFIPDTPDPENFPYAGQSNQTFWDNAILASKKMGYTFYLNEFNVSAQNGIPAVEVNIQNTGIAPMYAEWDVEFGYLNTTGDDFVSLGTTNSWNLNTIYPDNEENIRTFISSEILNDGEYTFMIRIVNPLKEGITLPDGSFKIYPNANPVRFANETQDEDLTGWITLGSASIVDGNLGTFPEIVSNLERDENFDQIMTLDSQQDLNVIVAPVSTSVTWVSNSPQVASVNQNGIVTTFNEAGEVEITAFTPDGQEVIFDITVSPYWKIPRLIEAEDFFAYELGAPTNPGAREQLITSGEDSGDTTIGFIGDNDIFEYAVTVNENTDFILDFRAVSFSGPGDSKMEILRENGDLIEEVTFGGQGVPNGTYGTFSSGVFNLTQGNHIIKLRVTRSNFDLNWIKFKTCFSTTTYTIAGGWNNGLPTTSTEAIITEDYDTATVGLGDINACSLTIANDATLTISAENFIQIENDITVNGTLLVAHQGSIVQVNSDANVINNGVINVSITTPLLKPRDFMMIGSPMTEITRENDFATANRLMSHDTNLFVPNPDVAEAFPLAENFADDNFNDYINHTGILNPGEGYLLRPRPINATGDEAINYTFTEGTLNSGTINQNIIFQTDQNSSYNLIANPYPSAINASSFINANAMIDAVYFWEHLQSPSADFPGANTVNFSMEDISMYNLTGGVAAASDLTPDEITKPNGFIATAQGFAIKASEGGTAVFTNAMRVTNNNNTLRSPSISDNKIWLSLKNTAYDLSSSTLIGFIENATSAYDEGYDTKRMATAISIYSHIEEGNMELGIQGREAFDTSKDVQLGFSSLIDINTSYTISIREVKGADIEQATVYLVDTFLNKIHNLTKQDYVFNAEKGTFNNRFVLQFEDKNTLSNESINGNTVAIYPNPTKGNFTISSPNTILTKVTITDINGRTIKTLTDVKKENLKIDISQASNGIYFIQLTTSNGTLVKRMIKE